MLYSSTFLMMESHIRLQSLTKIVLFFSARMPGVLFASGYPISRRKATLSLNSTLIHAVLLSTITTKHLTQSNISLSITESQLSTTVILQLLKSTLINALISTTQLATNKLTVQFKQHCLKCTVTKLNLLRNFQLIQSVFKLPIQRIIIGFKFTKRQAILWAPFLL